MNGKGSAPATASAPPTAAIAMPSSASLDLFGEALPVEAKQPIKPTPPPPVTIKENADHKDIPRRPYKWRKDGADFTTVWHVDSL